MFASKKPKSQFSELELLSALKIVTKLENESGKQGSQYFFSNTYFCYVGAGLIKDELKKYGYVEIQSKMYKTEDLKKVSNVPNSAMVSHEGKMYPVSELERIPSFDPQS